MCESIRIPLHTMRDQFRAQLGLPIEERTLHYAARFDGQIVSGSMQTTLDPRKMGDLEAIHEILRAQGVSDDAEIELGEV